MLSRGYCALGTLYTVFGFANVRPQLNDRRAVDHFTKLAQLKRRDHPKTRSLNPRLFLTNPRTTWPLSFERILIYPREFLSSTPGTKICISHWIFYARNTGETDSGLKYSPMTSFMNLRGLKPRLRAGDRNPALGCPHPADCTSPGNAVDAPPPMPLTVP